MRILLFLYIIYAKLISLGRTTSISVSLRSSTEIESMIYEAEAYATRWAMEKATFRKNIARYWT